MYKHLTGSRLIKNNNEITCILKKQQIMFNSTLIYVLKQLSVSGIRVLCHFHLNSFPVHHKADPTVKLYFQFTKITLNDQQVKFNVM